MRHVLEEPPQLQTAQSHGHVVVHSDGVVRQVPVQHLQPATPTSTGKGRGSRGGAVEGVEAAEGKSNRGGGRGWERMCKVQCILELLSSPDY